MVDFCFLPEQAGSNAQLQKIHDEPYWNWAETVTEQLAHLPYQLVSHFDGWTTIYLKILYVLNELQWDRENREHLKYLRNVYRVMTNHSKDHDTRTGHKLAEDANIPSRDSSQDSCQDSTRGSTIFRFPAIFTSCKSHDH